MKQLIYLDTAKDDLTEIETYMSDVGSQPIAVALVESLQTRCERIATLPGTLGTDRGDLRPGLRSTPHRNYIILFRYTAEAVEIVNVFHASRDVTTYYDED